MFPQLSLAHNALRFWAQLSLSHNALRFWAQGSCSGPGSSGARVPTGTWHTDVGATHFSVPEKQAAPSILPALACCSRELCPGEATWAPRLLSDTLILFTFVEARLQQLERHLAVSVSFLLHTPCRCAEQPTGPEVSMPREAFPHVQLWLSQPFFFFYNSLWSCLE